MDFRELAELLHGARIDAQSIDLGGNRVELVISRGTAPNGELTSVTFERVAALKWSGASAASPSMTLSVVGLEKLAPGEPWRLYVSTAQGAELELTCGTVSCNGLEVTGVGRSYRH